jgi:hypothetical protein
LPPTTGSFVLLCLVGIIGPLGVLLEIIIEFIPRQLGLGPKIVLFKHVITILTLIDVDLGINDVQKLDIGTAATRARLPFFA